MTKSNSLALAILRWPLVWGSLASLGFYALIHKNVLAGEFVDRYFASHPVEHISMTMFFVGLAALLFKAIDVASQLGGLDHTKLDPPTAGGQSAREVDRLLERLAGAPARLRNGYLVRRLRESLELVRRKGSSDDLDEHLRYLADLDVERMHSSYALVRIIIWAIPILGFLGTVIGITLAIANLNGQQIESSLPLVVMGLKVAFDTTALALALSIILMFAQFAADRYETRLLAEVDDRVARQLVGRFNDHGPSGDPHVAVVRRMCEAVVQSTDQLVERQAELWRATIDAAGQHWARSIASAGKQMEEGLSGSLVRHAESLAQAERLASEQNRGHWQGVQQALAKSSDAIARQQHELVKQGEILLQVVEATGQVKQLETALNKNLSALAGAGSFEETMTSLSAAIGLLAARLHSVPDRAARVDLQAKSSIPKAA